MVVKNEQVLKSSKKRKAMKVKNCKMTLLEEEVLRLLSRAKEVTLQHNPCDSKIHRYYQLIILK